MSAKSLKRLVPPACYFLYYQSEKITAVNLSKALRFCWSKGHRTARLSHVALMALMFVVFYVTLKISKYYADP